MRRAGVTADERGIAGLAVLFIVLGLGLMLGSIIGWFAFPDAEQQTTVTEIDMTSPGPSRAPDTEVQEKSTTVAQPAATPTITTVDKTTVTTNNSPATEKTTTTVAPKSSKRSEALFLAMFGTGFVLLLSGSLFDRIQSITGPGSFGIVLKDAGKATAEAIAQLEAAIKKHDNRLDYASRRITALSRRVAALEAGPHLPEEQVEALKVDVADAIAVEERVGAEEADLTRVSADLDAAEAARLELLRHLDKL